MAEIPNKHFIFVGGVHRSGTSLLHDALRRHADVSGFAGTGAPEDEGQHLQSVVPPAAALGGPGRFAFDPASMMDETHPLATSETAARLFADWRRHWDLEKPHLLEKSPPNIVRTRFLQRLFPRGALVMIVRHPLAVAYATLKWCPASAFSLTEHTLRCYERLLADRDHLDRLFVCRYEQFVVAPQRVLARLHAFAGLAEHHPPLEIDPHSNHKYFALWRRDLDALKAGRSVALDAFAELFAHRMSAFGYRLDSADEFDRVDWIDE